LHPVYISLYTLKAALQEELMSLLNFLGRGENRAEASGEPLDALLSGYSIEVMPRTAAKIEDFRVLLPLGTRVYIAHIEGTPIEDMVATARRLRDEGFPVMPHFPARVIKDGATLEEWIRRYRDEAGVDQALLLAGSPTKPVGEFHSSMQLMETGLFDKYGFRRLHVGGHPEGNKDIDPDGSTTEVDKALMWKQAFSERTDADMASRSSSGRSGSRIWASRFRFMSGSQGLPSCRRSSNLRSRAGWDRR
jgi:methylenetetrahydrofolate reductase (NADPH)